MSNIDAPGKIDDIPESIAAEYDAVLDISENDDSLSDKVKPHVSIGGLGNLSEQDRTEIQTEIEKIILENVEKNRQLQIGTLKGSEEKIGKVQDSKGQYKEHTALSSAQISLKGLTLDPEIEEDLLHQLTRYIKSRGFEIETNAAKEMQEKEESSE
jgi:hypothetical protein